MYNEKYLKYKNKYLELKFGGGISSGENTELKRSDSTNEIIVDNTNNILSYIRYPKPKFNIIDIIYIKKETNKFTLKKNEIIKQTKVDIDNKKLYLIDMRNPNDTKNVKNNLEIIIGTNLINYSLFYENYCSYWRVEWVNLCQNFIRPLKSNCQSDRGNRRRNE